MAPRRPRARDPSTDGIEEQVVTQHRRTREDVSDDNDSTEAQQSRRRLTKKPSQVRPSKATTSARASTSRRKSTRKDSSASENEDTPASRIDVANFRDQPIPSKESEKVNRLAGDWESVLKTIKSTALTLAVEAAAGMAEAGLGKDGDDALEELEKIETTMRELLDVQAELKAHQSSLEDLTNRIASGEEISDIVKQYDNGVEKKMEDWANKTSRQKYAKDEKFIELKSRVYEVQHPSEPMPPVTTFLPREEGDESDDDDDIEVGGVTQDYKCSLTLQTLTNPLKSVTCGHYFSEAGIRGYFQNSRTTKKQCPSTGCNATLSLNDFKPDKDLEKKVNAYKRRTMAREAEMQSGEEDEDDDEVL